jgi:hypothetical protein
MAAASTWGTILRRHDIPAAADTFSKSLSSSFHYFDSLSEKEGSEKQEMKKRKSRAQG